jgi:hypothetical protein
MAVDVDGDVAASMFARRGVCCIWQETHVLAHRDGQWARLGGGGASSEEDLLADRPAVLPDYLRLGRKAVTGAGAQVIAVSGSGGVFDDGDETRRRPGSGRWISYADVRDSAQVTSVRVAERRLRVPWRGHVLLVWSEREPPWVVAPDDAGRAVGEVLLA